MEIIQRKDTHDVLCKTTSFPELPRYPQMPACHPTSRQFGHGPRFSLRAIVQAQHISSVASCRSPLRCERQRDRQTSSLGRVYRNQKCAGQIAEQIESFICIYTEEKEDLTSKTCTPSPCTVTVAKPSFAFEPFDRSWVTYILGDGAVGEARRWL